VVEAVAAAAEAAAAEVDAEDAVAVDFDRVGLGWRPELAAGILAHLDRIDIVEVLLDSYLKASPRALRALRTLSRQVPITCHGVGLGLASSHPVDDARLDAVARLLGAIEPESWSEHLAFVRAGGMEIGHLAAPPRTEATVEGACANVHRASQSIGQAPSMENIATLIEPPGSQLGESEWTGAILQASGCGFLLDLHNLYANAMNTGRDPASWLMDFPLERVTHIHLSGGHWIPEPPQYASKTGGQRLLDDHVHDPPECLYDLLALVANRVDSPLTVILERDGAYPSMESLLAQLAKAREALVLGRTKRKVAA
jgi:uncharacterized protein